MRQRSGRDEIESQLEGVQSMLGALRAHWAARDEHRLGGSLAANALDDDDDRAAALGDASAAVECLKLADLREDAARQAHLKALDTAREVQAAMQHRKREAQRALVASHRAASADRHAHRFGHFGGSPGGSRRVTDPASRRLPIEPDATRGWNDQNRPPG